MTRYEVFDHTADLGILFEGRDLADLFETAAFAVFDLMTELPAVEERRTHRFIVTGGDREDLLVNFLRELLYLFNGRGFLVRRCAVRIDDAGEPETRSRPAPSEAVSVGSEPVPPQWRLEAEAAGEPFAPDRHRMKTEIKAVTYHGLEIRETTAGWWGRIVCDV
ncbi:MAG: archease [Syntrophales bacterium]|jgi:SHS2 domain-containing protein|nr:archease [Syntrophales bacterium]MDD4338825.1 archease [Syntrophales bacterium]HOG06696.1 archease [Syntrophales bacterium]HOS77663.1 archease [Syntrophales bacterium]HQN25794.1 archease [Syntrophales bacterium]